MTNFKNKRNIADSYLYTSVITLQDWLQLGHKLVLVLMPVTDIYKHDTRILIGFVILSPKGQQIIHWWKPQAW